MRLRLIVPAVVVSAIAVLLVLWLLGAPPGLAFSGALATAICVASTLSLVLVPLLERIESLASSVRGAAFRSPAPSAIVAGEDELEATGRTFNELSARWTQRAADLATETHTLTAVLDGMAEGVWMTDAEGTIIRHNRALKEMLGATTLEGERPLSLLRSTELNEAVTAACTRGDASRLEVSVEGQRPRILEIQVMPLGQELRGSAAVFRDVTALRRLEQVRKDFVANVSHELRTPITAIRGYAETLRDGALRDPEHAPRMVEIIHRQSERLSTLISGLLELSRLESGELQFDGGPLPLAEVVARAADVVRPNADQKRIRMSLEVEAGLKVIADARALEQVVLNLLDNAVKYTPEGGEVVVSGAREGTRCALFVRDTGPGIDEKHQPRIFERFYRVDKGRSRDTGGTGLGLSIVKHLVGAMQGDVRLSSRPGEGSTFTVLLPAARPSPGTSSGGTMDGRTPYGSPATG